MDRHHTTLTVQSITLPQKNVTAGPMSAALLGIVVAFASLFWIVSVAPTLVSFALAAATATAWCVWLDRHPADAADRQQWAHLASSRRPAIGIEEREGRPCDRV
jgi:hypothetical protein